MKLLAGEKEKPAHARKAGLRTGYTTGTCSAAASKAAALALLGQRQIDAVKVNLPIGQEVTLPVSTCRFDAFEAACAIVKDAGDDPDVTNGLEICATVTWADEGGINIDGGKGVGVVTKPGLGLPVGSPAINPVPRKMITQAVEQATLSCGDEQPFVCRGERPFALTRQGLRVIISVPRGEEVAGKTLNGRLGIVGGISILGTTGVVVPYSTSAYKFCIVQALDVARATGNSRVVLTTGGRSERFAQSLAQLPEEAFVQMGDFVGFALAQCARKGFRQVTMVGMVGKIAKIAAGNVNTHASRSTLDIQFLANVAAQSGAPPSVLDALRSSNTARHFSEMLAEADAPQVFDRLCLLARESCEKLSGGKLSVDCYMTDFDGGVIGRALHDG